jgi:DNA-binding transcriptional MerR regulator
MKSRIIKLGRQLGLSTEQINSIMEDTLHDTESVSLSLGPPYYPGAHYGSVSIIDFNHSQIAELGRQLGVTAEQIHSIMDDTLHDTEPVSLSLGPPHYPGSFYGTVSLNDFKS